MRSSTSEELITVADCQSSRHRLDTEAVLPIWQYYVADHTGSLDTVLRRASSTLGERTPNYGRRIKAVLVVCYLVMAWNLGQYVYQFFISGNFNDFALIYLVESWSLYGLRLYAVLAALVLIQLQTFVVYVFPQAIITKTFQNNLHCISSRKAFIFVRFVTMRCMTVFIKRCFNVMWYVNCVMLCYVIYVISYDMLFIHVMLYRNFCFA